MHPKNWTKEDYAKLTDKVYQGFLDTKSFPLYDWYLLADDDTFIHLENLFQFLSKKNSDDPVQYGHHFRPKVLFHVSFSISFFITYRIF